MWFSSCCYVRVLLFVDLLFVVFLLLVLFVLFLTLCILCILRYVDIC